MFSTLVLLTALFTNDPIEGSIIFVANSCRIVEKTTDSSLTHAAIVLKNDDGLYVYEATLPKVRKMPFSKYCKTFNKTPFLPKERNAEMCVAQPMVPFTKEEIKKIKEFAESSLGRPYSLKPYLKGEEKKGIHCSAFVTECLQKSGRAFSSNPGRVAPKNLWDSIEKHFIFSEWNKPK